jgi:Ni,Fe-hydrogenase III small subunit
LAIARYKKFCEPKIVIAIARATHENRVFRGDGVVEELNDPVDVGVIVNPALGKESGECVERRPGDAL